MLKTFLRLVAIILVFATVLVAIPVFGSAATTTVIEITKASAPIRASADNKGTVIAKCQVGGTLDSTGTVKNKAGNIWYKVSWKGSTRYIYSGNVKIHSHSNVKYTSMGKSFSVCSKCGRYTVDGRTYTVSSGSTENTYTNGVKMMISSPTMFLAVGGVMAASYMQYAGLAGTIAIADGPLPIGDFVALSIMGILACYAAAGAITKAQSISISRSAAKAKKSNSTQCKKTDFRWVSNSYGIDLRCMDNKCYNMLEAYGLVIGGQNVHTFSKASAEALCNLHVVSGSNNSYYRDIDTPNYNKYYHYHLRSNGNKLPAHIFYGTAQVTNRKPIGT